MAGLRICLAALVAVALVSCNRIEARTEFKAGNSAYEVGNYATAVKHYRRGLELDPTASIVWRSLGLAALANYRPGDSSPDNQETLRTAINALRRYLERHEDDTATRRYFINALLSSGTPEEALKLLEEEMRRRPEQPELLHAVIRILLDQGRLREAMERADASPAADPTVFYGIGVAAWNRSMANPQMAPARRIELAEFGIGALERALELDPNYAEAMAYMALLWREKAKALKGEDAEVVEGEAAEAYRNALERSQEWNQQAADALGGAAARAAGGN